MSSSYTTLGVNEHNHIPYLTGNDNIINIVIDPPVSVDLASFSTNQRAPYVQGSNNLITITIGDDSYAFKDVSISGNTITFTRLGQAIESIDIPDTVTSIIREERDLMISQASGSQQTIQLPPFYQGQVKSITYNEDATTAFLTFINGETVSYDITYYDTGTIATIVRKE